MKSSSTAMFWSAPASGEAARILLVRHGRVEWNAKSAYAGWTDLPLDEHGVKEAKMAAKRLGNAAISAVYSSDLVRARRTAEIIAEPHGLSVNIEPGIREINYGEWEGLGIDEVKKAYGEDFFRAWVADPENIRIPGGETFGELRDRASAAMARIAALHPGQTIAVVAHKSVNRVLICHWMGIAVGRYKQIEQKNCAINAVMLSKNRTVVETVNDMCFAAR
ncbi:MAG: histidine phosphatase family protein [Armatimonadota bacterium]